MNLFSESTTIKYSEWTDIPKVTQVYGVGLVFYQYYLKSFILLDLVLCILSLITITVHWVNGLQPESNISFDGSGFNLNNETHSFQYTAFENAVFPFVTASYLPETYPFLYGYMACHLLLIIAHPIAYSWFIQRHRHRANNQHVYSGDVPIWEDPWTTDERHLRNEEEWVAENVNSDVKVYVIDANDTQRKINHNKNKNIGVNNSHTFRINQIISNKHNMSKTEKYARNGVSIFCFILILTIYGVCLYYLQSSLYNRVSSLDDPNSVSINITISVLLSVIQAATDLIWVLASELLRLLEVHSSEQSYRKWQCMRLFLLRAFSYIVFYFVRTLVLNSQNGCNPQLLGIQHLILIISYMGGDLLSDFLFPLIYRSCRRKFKPAPRDYDNWYDIDIGEQYACIAFRHLILSSGATFMPGLSIFAMIGNWIQLKSDRYRFSNLVRFTHKIQSSNVKFVMFLGLACVLEFLIAYPKGCLFMWIDQKNFFNCDLLPV